MGFIWGLGHLHDGGVHDGDRTVPSTMLLPPAVHSHMHADV